MKETNKFWKWITSFGGELSNCDVANIYEILNQVELKVSSFKSRAKEVKEIYNYRFN